MTRHQKITMLVQSELQPVLFEVIDESSQHHAPQGTETHFKLIIVSAKFTNVAKVSRHRMINKLLANELATGLHALSLHLYTPEEWKRQDSTIPHSPHCKGGYHHG